MAMPIQPDSRPYDRRSKQAIISMNRAEREQILCPVKAQHAAYLASIASSPHAQSLHQRFTIFARKLRGFTRKELGSLNALKATPNLARLLFGLREDLQRFGLPRYYFDLEREIINRSIIAALDTRLTRKYDGYGAPKRAGLKRRGVA